MVCLFQVLHLLLRIIYQICADLKSTSAIETWLLLFQLGSQKSNMLDALASKPDLSASRAKASAAFTPPGVTGSLVAFIVFGTTEPLRKKMYQTFVPKRFQRLPTLWQTQPYDSPSNMRMGHDRIHSSHCEPQERDIGMIDLSPARGLGHNSKNCDDGMPIPPPPKLVVGHSAD
jgi:hypothetical protein